MTATKAPGRPGEVARYFFRLGCIAFGGPAAHVALMRRELVRERGWVSDQEFLDMLGVTNLIPGPNSTEMTMHLGHRRAGMAGLWLGGLLFLLPAVAIVTALAWAYVRYGTTPAGEGILLGAQPVVLALILHAAWSLTGAAFRGLESVIVIAAVTGLALLGVSEVALVLGAGIYSAGVTALVQALTRSARRRLPELPRAGGDWWRLPRQRKDAPGRHRRPRAWLPPLAPGSALAAAGGAAGATTLGIFLGFLKIGAVLYGSGYVLVSFMRDEFVQRRGWLTEAQLLDAIAAGQVTPGPLFSSAAFAGYVMDGFAGALAAAAGIFLPSFLFVMLAAPLVPRLRRWRLSSAFLDGVNAAAWALIVVVGVQLAREVLTGWFAWSLFVAALAAAAATRINAAWLVLGGVALGLGWTVAG
ncbi:chromate efflux transporter [Tepidiforma flava]|uniref:Chromate efflux transporter n=1 Tax=Tepidiforma flava TaxID=3004094 RepID=A0ABY7MB11_9CHLR|nr:chromate efflux transporter [Tepidiforma flava]WBL37219.1 chromate efflux transporter [Tepidiforma flava]